MNGSPHRANCLSFTHENTAGFSPPQVIVSIHLCFVIQLDALILGFAVRFHVLDVLRVKHMTSLVVFPFNHQYPFTARAAYRSRKETRQDFHCLRHLPFHFT